MKRLPITAELGTPGGLPVAMCACEETPTLRELLSNARSMCSTSVGPSSRLSLFPDLRHQWTGGMPARVPMQIPFILSVDRMSQRAAEKQCSAAWPVTVLAASMVAGPHPRSGNDA